VSVHRFDAVYACYSKRARVQLSRALLLLKIKSMAGTAANVLCSYCSVHIAHATKLWLTACTM
jgi:hypothetical protein